MGAFPAVDGAGTADAHTAHRAGPVADDLARAHRRAIDDAVRAHLDAAAVSARAPVVAAFAADGPAARQAVAVDAAVRVAQRAAVGDVVTGEGAVVFAEPPALRHAAALEVAAGPVAAEVADVPGCTAAILVFAAIVVASAGQGGQTEEPPTEGHAAPITKNRDKTQAPSEAATKTPRVRAAMNRDTLPRTAPESRSRRHAVNERCEPPRALRQQRGPAPSRTPQPLSRTDRGHRRSE